MVSPFSNFVPLVCHRTHSDDIAGVRPLRCDVPVPAGQLEVAPHLPPHRGTEMCS